MFSIIVFGTILLCTLPLIYASTQPEVTLEQGIVKGLYKRTFGNRLYSSFEGIPYAKPPLGKYRFKEPLPAEAWTGVYNATREPPKCLQMDMIGDKTGSEDCLYINVYTPKLPSEAGEKQFLDIIAFIHGGGFMSMESTFHKANILLDKDIIFVTFNYRLGALGFLSAEDDVLPGNNGLKDQTLALKWIKQNIAMFGGNPKSVTLAGISAGGGSCHLHLLSPLSKGLFKGAMCMSGASLNHWAIVKNPQSKALVVANELGCPTNETKFMVKCLQRRPAEHIIDVTKSFWSWKLPYPSYGPVIEPAGPNAFISERPIDILKRKGAMDIPLLLSFTADEGLNIGAALHAQPALFDDLMNRWNEILPIILFIDDFTPSSIKPLISQKIKEHYQVDKSTEDRIIKLIGDCIFLHGIGKLAKLHASLYKSPVYVYRFSYRGEHSLAELFTPDDLGVSHGDDALYLTDTPLFKELTLEADIEMSKEMVDVWLSFAANGSLSREWIPVQDNYPKITLTDIEGPSIKKTVVDDEIGEEKFWDSIFATIFG
ncbi:esterase FE4 [Halyomorpha halys]|uniref:esterase FE4 n=1 Tax=Halyomorpha halys TaxID=286706 RepID=UPI0006D4E2C5|nr:esterase FE4 [Halyomorpha halys]